MKVALFLTVDTWKPTMNSVKGTFFLSDSPSHRRSITGSVRFDREEDLDLLADLLLLQPHRISFCSVTQRKGKGRAEDKIYLVPCSWLLGTGSGW